MDAEEGQLPLQRQGRTERSRVVTATIANQTVTVKAKGVQIRFALRGRGPQGAVAVRLIVPGSSPATLCAAFPGGQGEVKRDDPVKGVFKAVGAEAPSTCALP